MWARAEGSGTIKTNATGRCAARLCCSCGGAECMCQCQKALELFRQMQQEGVWPDSVTFVGVLSAYACGCT
ncbi:unnamed protein product [Sphagnum balticum]